MKKKKPSPAKAAGVQGRAAKGTQSKYAGFWIRLAASLIDGLILMAAIFIYAMLAIIPVIMFGDPFKSGSLLLALFFILVIFLGFFLLIMYEIWFTKKKGATPGKMAVGIKVVKLDSSRIGWGDSIVRYLVKSIGSSWIVLYLGVLWIIWDKRKQGWHDKAAGTVVVYK